MSYYDERPSDDNRDTYRSFSRMEKDRGRRWVDEVRRTLEQTKPRNPGTSR